MPQAQLPNLQLARRQSGPLVVDHFGHPFHDPIGVPVGIAFARGSPLFVQAVALRATVCTRSRLL